MACLYPITIQNPNFYKKPNQPSTIPVACRTCPPCLQARTNSWVFKLLQEDKLNHQSYFVTLTMDNNYMGTDRPINKYGEVESNLTPNGFLTLRKRDLQLFFKRLRKYEDEQHRLRQAANPHTILPQVKIRYYACGEYGGTTERPHYHIIIFGASASGIEKAWIYNKKPIGIITVDSVTGASIAYTTKYLHKGKLIPKHERDDRLPEFQLFSKNLGINYITPQIIKYHNNDPLERNCVTLDGGIRMAMPATFRKKIFDETVRDQQATYIQEKTASDKEKYITWWLQANPDKTLVDFYKSEAESKQQVKQVFKQRQKERRKI